MNKKILTTAVIALVLGTGIGYLISLGKPSAHIEKQGIANKPLYFRNPMNPEITSPIPAKDDMGMDYIPVYAEGRGMKVAPGTVRIDSTVVQDMGVRTSKVRHEALSRNIRTVGRVVYDEGNLIRLHPRYSGWVEKLYADKTGQQVKKGRALLSIYSPEIVSSQQEYLLALNNSAKDSPFADVRNGAKSLLESTRERLRLFDMPENQLERIEAGRKAMQDTYIDSPISGIVTNIGAREGDRVTPETELYAIADLSTIWVLADLYENDMPWVKKGDTVSMQVPDIPGRSFVGRIAYIYPYVEAKTRTVKVRIELGNRELTLKPDMYANVDIHSDRQVDALTVPSEAVIRTGARNLIFIQKGPGRFEPRDVTLGVSSNGRVQILNGVKEGEIVVTSGQFLLDSESKIREAAARMTEPKMPEGMKMGGKK